MLTSNGGSSAPSTKTITFDKPGPQQKEVQFTPPTDPARAVQGRAEVDEGQADLLGTFGQDAKAESETHLGTNDSEQVPVREQCGRAILASKRRPRAGLLTVLCEQAGRPNDVGLS
jgi:hypothetical protein